MTIKEFNVVEDVIPVSFVTSNCEFRLQLVLASDDTPDAQATLIDPTFYPEGLDARFANMVTPL